MKSLCLRLGFLFKQLIKMVMQALVFPTVYWFYSRRPVEEDLIILADGHKSELPYSMEEVYRVLKDGGYKVVTFFRRENEGYIRNLLRMISFMKLYSRARVVFICDNFLPVASCNKRKETTVVQLWHAGGILKKYAYDTKDDIPAYYRGNVFKNYNLISVSAPCCIPVYERAMRQEKGIVKALGISRTDRFFKEEYKERCLERFYKYHPEAKGKKVILWAPTFRGKAGNPHVIGGKAIEKLQRDLGADWYVITKLHPHMNKCCDLRESSIPTEELLPVIDLLITDYSSVLFDYVLLDKPLVLYAPDLQEYIDKRGLYIDYSELPGIIVTEEENLTDAVLSEHRSYNPKRTETFREKYMSACDGKSTERILKEIGIKL
ncbi:CDP-glycerol glycerophosphotransferase family protein [Alloiococcus sp. CFN-8]|uniref:CDP-glycerol glycerophosphotransferase family protein n=1 Tax=Alloiococcus sp. CFN-8 TaxID=3416081 RepID=UPI003CF2003E